MATDPNTQRWFMITLVGPDRPGIVARLSAALHREGHAVGEGSMARLGGQFSTMLMAQGSAERLERLAASVAESMGLAWHVDAIDAALHQQRYPDARITAGAPERPGILDQVSNALADAGLEIVTLEADLAGGPEEPVYIVHLEGVATRGMDTLRGAADRLRDAGIDIDVAPLERLEG